MHNRIVQLLARAARSGSPSSAAGDPGAPLSIFSLTAARYGTRPAEDMTIPTGFDPAAVVLFEAIVEGAFLVATADGDFDDEERRAFERVVVEACGGTVSSAQTASLLADLSTQLENDGRACRIDAVAASVTKKDHGLEVLRVAALIAQASGGVSEVERQVLATFAGRWGLAAQDVEAAVASAETALQAQAD